MVGSASSENSRRPSLVQRVLESGLLAALLVVFWIILSGRLTALAITLGVLSALVVTALTPERLLWVGGAGGGGGGGEREFGIPVQSVSLRHMVRHGVQLLAEIAVANVQVAILVLHPKLPIDPAFVRFKTTLRRALPQVVLANLITVTPGTVTVDLEKGNYLVHSLSPRLANDLLSGHIPNTVARMLGELPGPPPEVLGWSRSVKDIPS